MNPKIINAHTQAHQLAMKEYNALMHLQGIYMRDAIESSICNAFRKGEKYEYPKQPYDIFEKPITETDENRQINEVFANLEAMQKRFEEAKKKKEEVTEKG